MPELTTGFIVDSASGCGQGRARHRERRLSEWPRGRVPGFGPGAEGATAPGISQAQGTARVWQSGKCPPTLRL